MTDAIRENVNRLCALKSRVEDLGKQIGELEAFFLKQAEKDLRDTKIKTVTYTGDHGNVVSATMAATVKMEHPTLLKKAFGKEYAELVTEKTTYSIKDAAKRMLAGLFLKNYTKETIEGVLRQVGLDNDTLQVLLKKVKGINFKKDTENLMRIAKLDRKEAQYYAYFAYEAAVWESFMRIMKGKGGCTQQEIAETLSLVDGAIIVEETPKITVEPSEG
ncbi:MAG: hypothetical protein BWY15_00446 [Firmicutes bacterium ADurb.Bin193]|nr:MAG: hypothetical protein BWY15_00446 [Firmicutes bacterium ADurb.Bin193]